MKKIIILAMHGMTPKDFPAEEKREYMRLRSQFHSAHPSTDLVLKQRFEELERKMRQWPRTEKNDPFFHASRKMALELEALSGAEVWPAFNEFCAPSIDEVLVRACQSGAWEIIVTTPMLTPGGHHSEEEIPELIEAAQKRFPNSTIRYAWPFSIEKIAVFLHQQITQK